MCTSIKECDDLRALLTIYCCSSVRSSYGRIINGCMIQTRTRICWSSVIRLHPYLLVLNINSPKFRNIKLNISSFQYLRSSSLLKMWNNLPLDLKRSNSLSIFKNRLLNSLFENYRTMCYKPNCYSCKTN